MRGNSRLLLSLCLGGLLLLGLADFPSPESDAARLEAGTPPGMVLVSAGEFWLGSNDPDAEDDVSPLKQVTLPAFYVDRTEVTNAQYRQVFPDHRFPAGQEQHPVTGVTRDEAEKYLKAVGKRLPTCAEWEKAARGTDGRRYPWGDELDPGRAHLGRPRQHETCSFNQVKPVGSFPAGASPYGCLDMAGNAWEWVADDAPGGLQIIRGGAFGYPERQCRVYAWALEQPGVP
ncbi:MAG: SUMF1/EgtB/PvdO family nonheme iron enzyme [Armatimonadetes bacterium]|nr:SUMF1/EgtB/PvdO family nonheme iron enzyme [Armatimonadota bacterium]